MKKKKMNNTVKRFVIPSIALVVMLVATGLLYAYIFTTRPEILYQKRVVNELELYLPRLRGFEEADNSNNDLTVVGNDMMVTVLCESKDIFTANNVDVPNLFSYTAVIVNNNDVDVSSIKENNGYYTFELVMDYSGEDLHYYAATFESNNNFYLVQFICVQKDASRLQNKIGNYLDMIKIVQD